MAKNKISEWSSTAANNTDVGGIDLAEGCAPSGINNALREIMSQVKDMQAGTDGDNFTVGGNLSVTGTTTATGAITANGGITGDLTGNVTGNVTGTASDLSATLAVNKGGTGVTTSTGTGNVVLSNSPTLVTPALGTPSALVATNATGTANSLNAGIGVNQTWQDVTASRALNTTYTNNTGKPIMVHVVTTNTGSSNGIRLTLDGTLVFIGSDPVTSTGGFIMWISVLIPNNSTYLLSNTAQTLIQWLELR